MKWNDIISKVIAVVGGIVAFFGTSLIGMPVFIFRLAVSILTGYIVWCGIKLYCVRREHKELKIRLNRYAISRYKDSMAKAYTLNDSENMCNEIAHTVEDYLNRDSIPINDNAYKKECEPLKNQIIVGLLVIIVLSITNSNHAIGFAQELVDKATTFFDGKPTQQVGDGNAEETIQQEDAPVVEETVSNGTIEEEGAILGEITGTGETLPEENEEGEMGITDENPESNNEREAAGWIKFKLEHPESYHKINTAEYGMLYEKLFYVNEDDLEEAVIIDITIGKNGCKVNMPLDNIATSQGRNTEYYTKIEIRFLKEEGNLLSSDLLDEVIEGREELYALSPNNKLVWLLANHYQTYALNYWDQSNDWESVLYLYMKSINEVWESLEFEMDETEKYERLKYIQARYKDIAECKILDEAVRLKASEIYLAMETRLNEGL